MTTTKPTAAECAAGLRQLADAVEALPDIDPFYLHTFDGFAVWYLQDRASVARVTRAVLAAGGTVEKGEQAAGGLKLQLRFAGVRARVHTGEQVCERVVTGTREITEEIPDPTVDVPRVKVTRTEEIVEWVCPPSILAAETSA